MEQPAQDIYDGPTLSTTINREGNRVHRLIDDTVYPLRASTVVVRRDPMVAALFGVATIKFARSAPTVPKKSRPPR